MQARSLHRKEDVAHNVNKQLKPTEGASVLAKESPAGLSVLEEPDNVEPSGFTQVFCSSDEDVPQAQAELETLFRRWQSEEREKRKIDPSRSPTEKYPGLAFFEMKIGGVEDKEPIDIEIVQVPSLKIRFMADDMLATFKDGSSLWQALRECLNNPLSKFPSREGFPVFIHTSHDDPEPAYYSPWTRRLAVYRMLALMGRCPTVLCRVAKKDASVWQEFYRTTSNGRFAAIRGTDEVIGSSFTDTKFTIFCGRSWRIEVDARLAQWCEAAGPLGQVVVCKGNELGSFTFNRADVRQKVVLAFRGDCSFEKKAFHAQDAGADGLIIAQDTDDPPIMVDSHDVTVKIPCATVTNAVGRFMLACLRAGETVSAVHVRGTNRMLLVGSGYPPAIPSDDKLREQELILELGRVEAERRSLGMQVEILETYIAECQKDRNARKADHDGKEQRRIRRMTDLALRVSEEKARELMYQQDKNAEEKMREERRLYSAMEKQRLREQKADAEHRRKQKNEKQERARLRKQRALRGYVLAVHAKAQDKIAQAFAPTVVHTAFGRRGSYLLIYEDGYVDFSGLTPHISAKLAKAKVPGGQRIRYASMAPIGEDYFYFLHENGKVDLDVPLSLRRVLSESFVTPERVVFGPGDSWVVIWPGGVCDWQGLPDVLADVLRDNNYRKRRPVAELSIGAPEHYGSFSDEMHKRTETWPWFVMFRDGWFCSDNLSDALEDALEDVRKMSCVARSITLGDQAEWMLRYSPLAPEDAEKVAQPEEDEKALIADQGFFSNRQSQTGTRPSGPPAPDAGTRAIAAPHPPVDRSRTPDDRGARSRSFSRKKEPADDREPRSASQRPSRRPSSRTKRERQRVSIEDVSPRLNMADRIAVSSLVRESSRDELARGDSTRPPPPGRPRESMWVEAPDSDREDPDDDA
jgi:hypothetical protein